MALPELPRFTPGPTLTADDPSPSLYKQERDPHFGDLFQMFLAYLRHPGAPSFFDFLELKKAEKNNAVATRAAIQFQAFLHRPLLGDDSGEPVDLDLLRIKHGAYPMDHTAHMYSLTSTRDDTLRWLQKEVQHLGATAFSAERDGPILRVTLFVPTYTTRGRC